jgi:hypothetical protein
VRFTVDCTGLLQRTLDKWAVKNYTTFLNDLSERNIGLSHK